MPRMLKCYGTCGKTYPKEELIKVGTQNHCKTCAEQKEKDQKDRKLLYSTIQKIFNVPYPSGYMLKQIKTFQDERNYTYEGMTQTLCYVVKVLKMKPSLKGGLSLIPYHYDNAINYYRDLEEKRKNMGDVIADKEVIVMKPLKHSTENIRSKVFIDMKGLI